VVSITPRPLYPGKDPVPIVQDARCAPGPVWTCAKNLAPTEIRFPDRPVRSQLFYRLSYAGPRTNEAVKVKVKVKQSHYRPGQALRVPGVRGSQISGQSTHKGGEFVSPRQRPPLPPGIIPGTHLC
jgi:hypothetical protein